MNSNFVRGAVNLVSSYLYGAETDTINLVPVVAQAIQADQYDEQLMPNREIIAITDVSAASFGNGSTNDNEVHEEVEHDDEEFVRIDFKKLSYAEIASLKGLATSGYPVFNETDLGTDVSDYQMTAQFKKQRSASSSSQKSAYLRSSQVDGEDTLFVGGKHTAHLMNDLTLEEMVDNGLNEMEGSILDQAGFKKFTKSNKKLKGKSKAKKAVAHSTLVVTGHHEA